jgi:hypothetical protein
VHLFLSFYLFWLNNGSFVPINQEEEMKSHLAIELSEHAVHFARLNDGQVQSVDKFSFKDKIDYRYKEQLDQFLIEKGLREIEFDEYSLSWYSIHSTLLPNNVFGESKPEDLFRLCYSEDIPSGDIDYNRIPELSVVNVFAIPHWVKSFFVIKFPRIVIQQEGSHLLHGIFAGSTFKMKAVICLHRDSFSLVIAHANELEFYSQFVFQSLDDIVYNFMFTLQQKNFFDQNGSIVVYNGVGGNEGQDEELKSRLSVLKDLKSFAIKISDHLLLNYQTLCV